MRLLTFSRLRQKERAAKSQGDSKEVSTPHKAVDNEFNSEDDEILLKCAVSQEDTESVFENMSKYVFMSSNMISYIINYPLSERFSKLSLNVKRIFSIEEKD